jgi:APA family basic amino acid/polyamine antiporter
MTSLRRVLGLPALLFYGVGVIIGAGIYSVIGAAAGVAGDELWISFALAAGAAALAGLSYAELATMMPEAGAEYTYLRTALPRRPAAAFAIGVVLTLANAATAATVAIAFAGYLRLFVAIPALLAALLVLAGCTLVTIAGLRESTWIAATCTLIEVAGLVIVIAAGFGSDAFGRVPAPSLHAGVFSGAALIFFVYTGFEGLANLAGEAKDPGRTIPLAILLSLAVTTVLYVLVAIAAVGLVEPSALAASDAPLATVAAAVSPRLAAAIGWMALVSTLNTALTTVIVGSRLLFGMAAKGDMPRVLARVSAGRGTPWVAALAMLLMSVALTPLGGVEAVAQVSALATLLAFIGVHVALIVLRRRKPRAKRPFRVPGAIAGFPVTPCLGIAVAVALLTQFAWPIYTTVVAVCVAATAGYAVFGGRRSKPVA